MAKSADAFRSIGEVAKLVGVAPHVLRYWETQFSQLKPVKRRDGRRYYRPDDVRLAAGLCEVLREEGLTIRGARKMLARDRGQAVRDRGATRLGEAMGAAAPEAEATAEQAAPAAPAKSRVRRRPAAAPPEAQPLPLFPEWQADEAPEAVADAAPVDEPAPVAETAAPADEPAPAAEPVTETIPVASSADSDPGHAEWLHRLTALSQALAARPDGATPAPALRAAAQSLRDAIDAHY